MLARIALASNALDTNGLPPAIANVVHASLLKTINAHGRLVFGSDAEVSALLRAVKSGNGVPAGSRARWTETLARLQKHSRISVCRPPADPALATVLELSALRVGWASIAEVAVLSNDACTALGVSTETGVLTDPSIGLDVASTATAPTSPALLRYTALEELAVANQGTPREAFWDSVLKPLAHGSKQVTVLDGYLLGPLLALHHRKPWTRHWNGEHLGWLLERLDGDLAGGSEVRLIANRDRDYPNETVEDIASLIRAAWAPTRVGRISQVTLSLAAPHGRERFPHDRHIRFSTGAAVKFEAGIDRLRDATIWDPEGMEWKYRWRSESLADLQTREDRAKGMATGPDTIVFSR